jgi:hypothetical protein
VVKDGKQWGKQTYLCTVCYRRFTPNAKHVFRPKHIKEQAILKALKQRDKVRAISIDEAWSFAGKKENDVWIWSVVVEYFDGRTEKYLFVGKRDLKTFLKDTK